MRFAVTFASLALALAAPLLAQAAEGGPQPVATLENRDMSTGDLSEKLSAGGLVILMRHERTNVPSRGDDYSR
ncbi:MAG: hypothetical protein ACK554_02745, partial [Erythrobacteraceae bacterium]